MAHLVWIQNFHQLFFQRPPFMPEFRVFFGRKLSRRILLLRFSLRFFPEFFSDFFSDTEQTKRDDRKNQPKQASDKSAQKAATRLMTKVNSTFGVEKRKEQDTNDRNGSSSGGGFGSYDSGIARPWPNRLLRRNSRSETGKDHFAVSLSHSQLVS